jgi:hypothetical protein
MRRLSSALGIGWQLSLGPERSQILGLARGTRDAGLIVLRSTFDGDELIDQEILVDKGPHPAAESDFELFCEIMPEALGIKS